MHIFRLTNGQDLKKSIVEYCENNNIKAGIIGACVGCCYEIYFRLAGGKNFYHKIGGHNIELSVIDDMDLLSRTFIYGRMAKVDKVLYIQHEGVSESGNERGTTTTSSRFKEIQRVNYLLQRKYDKEIHDRILELGFEDPVWDEESGCSDVNKKIDIKDLPIMDVLIMK